ncbi:PEP-CTERM domain protein [Oopsacas minuta]|uniref:PEP-CTERM domain protein n=1 Tax=Oopsacas minuta TaxID=111878 RepID=A0AAV7K3M8_9METZ|nr:PEP-CTERM domain protein [Oopsacas minuta]
MLEFELPEFYTKSDKNLLKSSLTKCYSYLEIITQIKSELCENRSSILSDIEVSYQIIFDKVEFEKSRLVKYVSNEFDVKLTELTRLELELNNMRREVLDLVEQDTQFNSHETETGSKYQVLTSNNTFENQFLSLDSIHSLHSYVTNMSLRGIEVPEYKFEIDQLSISALLTGRLVPENVIVYDRDYSSLNIPLKYMSVPDQLKSSIIQDATIGANGDIYAVDRGNTQIHIFDSEFKYKYSFGQHGHEIGEFLCPWSISFCSHTNRIIVSDCIQPSVQSFDLVSQVVQRVKFGSVEKYAQIGGICVGTEGAVYVVSSWENCVKVLSTKFKIISHIGKDLLEAPKDVKVLRDEIFVLEALQPHFKIFSTDNDFLREISTEIFLCNPWFFCIDPLTGIFIVTEFSKHQVRVINTDGNILHKFGDDLLSFPAGVVMNNKKQVFVCDTLHLRLIVF